MRFRDILRSKTELSNENERLRFEVSNLQKKVRSLEECANLVNAYELTEMLHPSCRGCAKAAWMIGPWDELFFVGCTKDNPCAEFIPETKIVWCSSDLREKSRGLTTR